VSSSRQSGDAGAEAPALHKLQGHATCAVEVSPAIVDAGASLTLRCTVRCSPACELRGHALSIRDQSGAEVARVELTEFDGEANLTGAFVVKAPVEEGEKTWAAVCPAVEKEGVSYAEGSTPLSFTVKAHSSTVLAWDMPSAIVAGARFRMKIGIKCSSECDLTNRAFGIYDHDGAPLATGALGALWPDTTALHGSEVELDAPAVEGLFRWSARIERSHAGIPHAEGSVDFGVRVVRAPEHRVTVEAIDRVTRGPIDGARVVMHPYTAATDGSGIATVQVAAGAYTLFVTKPGYLTFGLPVDVSADMTASAELDVEPVPERN
jgi:hypothetical protein